jgi:ElaB/YqjD/DUF883 family membrane-anchored ribosome-binding protein
MDGLVRDAVVERGVLAERFAIDTATADSMPLPTRLCMTSGKTATRLQPQQGRRRMSEVTTEQTQSSTSTTEQAKERLGEGAQQIQEKASEAKARTRDRFREQIDTRSSETGEQMTSTASALRQTAERLRTEQREPQAKLLEQIADRAERFGRYLTETNGERMLRDIERVARGRPWLVAGGGTVVGFLAARFTKASSSRRYEENGGTRSDVHSPPALPRGSTPGVRGGGDSGDF